MALKTLLAGYLSQDWREDFESSAAAVTAFVDGARVPQLLAASADIDGLLEQPGVADDDREDGLQRQIQSLGGSYDPTDDGVTREAWLRGVLDAIHVELDRRLESDS
ncbi:contact-dependent growth inhibition system immunity protein [Aquihabitans sp. McL0605]|uniref:contact-dependent growth inhibition system immunity protein n=1 Tax=Aquihabitans sp. McL0605 TaxID=3415671 RepID=UPI003CF6B174